MQQNDEHFKITLTQWTHANVVKFIFDLYWRVPLERHLLSTVYSLQSTVYRKDAVIHTDTDTTNTFIK